MTPRPEPSTDALLPPCATSEPKSWSLCQEAGLYQIDLLGGSKNRVTEREYWTQKKGQLALDNENAAQGKPPTKFEMDKGKLRREIRAVLAVAVSFEDFAQRLL